MSASPDDDRLWFEHATLAVLPDLVSTALRLTRNRADAEDLVADAIARAWLGLGSLRERERFRGWIFRILTNLFLSERRAHAGRPEEEPLDEGGAEFSLFERLHQPFLLWWSSPEQEFLDKLVREDLTRAIDALPEPFRLVVVLADVQGLSYQAVSETLAVPVGTVRSRLARGRALLQRALWAHACDAGLRPTAQDRKPGTA
ncbi:MAG TPA: sigma-70 family RNA polymerase sigma factor [Gemmatimonadales bacterium]|nr:sigma-70 family RNA polymerase sigma factor [Gemmatimonadales bacterium]